MSLTQFASIPAKTAWTISAISKRSILFPEDTGIPGRKDLLVQVTEKRTGALNFGAGFSTIESLLGFVELTQGNFDLFNWPTFTGGGQKFRARVQYGTETQNYVVSLTEPYFLDRPLSLGGDLFYQEASYLSSIYNQKNYGLALELRKPLSPPFVDQPRLSVGGDRYL